MSFDSDFFNPMPKITATPIYAYFDDNNNNNVPTGAANFSVIYAESALQASHSNTTDAVLVAKAEEAAVALNKTQNGITLTELISRDAKDISLAADQSSVNKSAFTIRLDDDTREKLQKSLEVLQALLGTTATATDATKQLPAVPQLPGGAPQAVADVFSALPESMAERRREVISAFAWCAQHEALACMRYLQERFEMTKEDVTNIFNPVILETAKRNQVAVLRFLHDAFGLTRDNITGPNTVFTSPFDAACSMESTELLLYFLDTYDITAANSAREMEYGLTQAVEKKAYECAALLLSRMK